MRINFSDMPPIKDDNSIFLAGPTLRNASFQESWRKEACNMLESLGFNGTVYVPEFSVGNNPPNFLEQAWWERECLLNAGCIVFYVNRKFPENPGMTTNVEFGMYLAKRPKCVFLCTPDGYDKNRYLDWLYDTEMKENNIDRKVYKTMRDVLEAAVEFIK